MFDVRNHEHLTEEQIFDCINAGSKAANLQMENCPVCRAAADSLRRTLDQASLWTAPERDKNYGAAVWQQIAPGVVGSKQGRSAARRLGWALVWCAIAATAVVAIWFVPRAKPPHSVPIEPVAASDRLLQVAVQDHVHRADTLLERIETDGTQPARARESEQAVIDNLVAESRLYRQTAEQEKNERTARLLSDLETGLLNLKHDAGVPPQSDVRELRRKLVGFSALEHKSGATVPASSKVERKPL